MRRVVRDISSVLILTGLLLLVDGGVTLLWQEPVTAAIALVKRSNVSHQYLSYRTAPLTHTQSRAVKQIHTSKQRISYLARTDLARIKTGAAMGQIEIPKIGHT
jgi:sortase (surface protein transpeptidase)